MAVTWNTWLSTTLKDNKCPWEKVDFPFSNQSYHIPPGIPVGTYCCCKMDSRQEWCLVWADFTERRDLKAKS